MENIKFASTRLESFANVMKTILNDGGRYNDLVIEANTSVSLKAKKEGCPFGTKDDVRKDCEYNVSINGIYKNAVNKALKKELSKKIESGEVAPDTKIEEYQPKQNWFVKIFDSVNGSIVVKRSEIENDLPITEIYLLVVNNSSKSLNYYIQGKLADEQTIELIKANRKDRAQETAKTQGLEDKENAVIVSTIAFSNITQIRANNMIIEI